MLCRRPPNPISSAAEQLLKRQLQWLFLLRTLFITLLLGLTAIILTKGHSLTPLPIGPFAFLIIGVYCFTLLSSALLRVIPCLRQFTYLQVILDILLTSSLVFFSGSSQSVFTAVYFLPIIAGGLLLFRRGGLLMAAISTLAYGALLLLEHAGQTRFLFATIAEPAARTEMLLHIFSINGLSFFLVAILSSTLAERLHKVEAVLSQTTANLDRLALLYKQIFDDIATGVITVDGDNRITSFNRAAERITGYQSGEMLDRKIEGVFPGLLPSAGMDGRPQADLARKDGEVIPVGYSWARLNTPDGCENCRVFTLQDLSQIRKMELQVRQAEKMAAIGEMAAGIAHEFRNPLAAISGSAQLLAHRISTGPQSRKLMEIIIRECDRLEAVIAEFLLFSKPALPEKTWCRLGQLVDETAQVLQQSSTWDGRCRLARDFPEELSCWADAGQLRQVLLNLCSNSCQAMEDGGKIVIAAGEKNREGKRQLRITVQDSGPGIPAQHLPRVFDPYFTTKENGTGLGLAIVHQLIASHGGTISAQNLPGHGASFTITLPLP
jgi:two-component system sensor histidine kinase PilS (NtrC family)